LTLQIPLIVSNEQPGSPVTFKATVVGGTPPFSLEVSWGDGNTEKNQADGPVFELSHTYVAAGDYKITVNITDVLGVKTTFQTVAHVSGAAPAAPVTKKPTPLNLVIAWPLLAMAALTLVGFALGAKFQRGRDQNAAPRPEGAAI
jgi:hypothetical protein